MHFTQNSDSPKDAKLAEESDVNENQEGQKGTFQSEDERPQPTNMGDAKATARGKKLFKSWWFARGRT